MNSLSQFQREHCSTVLRHVHFILTDKLTMHGAQGQEQIIYDKSLKLRDTLNQIYLSAQISQKVTAMLLELAPVIIHISAVRVMKQVGDLVKGK